MNKNIFWIAPLVVINFLKIIKIGVLLMIMLCNLMDTQNYSWLL